MQSPSKLAVEFFALRPHFCNLSSWLLEPLSRATKHIRVGVGRPCKCCTTALGLVWLRLGDSDFRTLLEISRGEYDICLQGRPRPRTVLDLGANVGLSVRLWQLSFPGVRVVAIEPSSSSTRLLRRNVADGPNPNSTEIIEAAVNTDGRSVFLDQSGDSDSHKVGAIGTRVAGISIDEAIQRAAAPDGMVDLVKMDIEGSEQSLMECASRWAPKVRYLLIEIHGAYTEELFQRDLLKISGFGSPRTTSIRSAPGVATYFVELNPYT
jgi:FkbM family methyltransferase